LCIYTSAGTGVAQSDGPGIDSRWCHWGFFPLFLPTKPCALRSTQPLKMSTGDFSWCKDGRCVRLTTYLLVVPNVEMIRGLNLPGTPRATSACRGTPLLFTLSVPLHPLYTFMACTSTPQLKKCLQCKR
jgi:hypothetical protein